MQQQVEHHVGDRAEHADAHEAQHRAGRRQARDAAQVLDRGAHDVHARVGVVDPVDRDLVDAQPASLGEHEQLGVEEPAVVAHVVEQVPGGGRRHGLEAALRVGEARPQHGAQQAVVGARDELALGAADDARRARQARADGQVAVARQQRRHERQQAAQVGRQIDVHVAEHPRVAARPRLAQGQAAALAIERQDLDAGQRGGQRPGDGRRGVRARVVGDDDPPRERQLGRQEAVQPAHAALERGLLVEDGHHDLDARSAVARARRRARSEGLGSVCSVMATASARDVGPRWEAAESRLGIRRPAG